MVHRQHGVLKLKQIKIGIAVFSCHKYTSVCEFSMQKRLHLNIFEFSTAQLRNAVLGNECAGGVVFIIRDRVKS